jgi:VanZ family protein
VNLPWLELGLDARQDLVANGLLFIPIGFLWTAAMTRRWQPLALAAAATAGLVITVALAFGIEFAQAWFPNRTQSWNDVVSECVGGTVGVALWLIAGRSLSRQATQLLSARGIELAHKLLALYAWSLLIFSAIPCDFVLSLAELRAKYHAGRLAWLAPANISLTRHAAHLVLLALAFVPAGVWLHIALTRRATTSRSSLQRVTLVRWLMYSIAFSAACEAIQFFVYSRYTSLADVLAGWAGLAIGTSLRLAAQRTGFTVAAAQSRPGILLCVSLAYSVLLAAVFWYPFEWQFDTKRWTTALNGFFRPPFAAHYVGTEFNALANVLFRAGSFGVLGGLLGWTVVSLPATVRAAAWQAAAVYAMMVSAVVELAQIALADHIADLTDVLVGAVAAWLAMLLVVRLKG